MHKETFENRKQKENSQSFDAIIIGGGAAGLSAALWCAELGLSALLLESKPELGGQLLHVYNPIKNHLGVETENGLALRDIFLKQVENFEFAIRTEASVSEVNLKDKSVLLETGESFFAKALVIATGVRRRKLNVEGEDKFTDNGIIESGKRDKDSVTGKRVCIIGGGDAAAENALILSETAKEVFLVHRSNTFRARSEFMEKAAANEKVKILTETLVKKLHGEKFLEAIELQNLNTGKVFTLPVEAMLLRIGVEPDTTLLRGKLKLDKNGYIKINSNCETSIEKVFAIGDVANPIAPTVSSAVGMGATAAKVIFDRLQQEK